MDDVTVHPEVRQGDPIAHAGENTKKCAGCRERFPKEQLVVVEEGRHDNLVFFDGDRVCKPCARRNAVAW